MLKNTSHCLICFIFATMGLRIANIIYNIQVFIRIWFQCKYNQKYMGGGCEYYSNKTTVFMRTCWFIAYNIRLEPLRPAGIVNVFPKFAEVIGRQTDTHTWKHPYFIIIQSGHSNSIWKSQYIPVYPSINPSLSQYKSQYMNRHLPGLFAVNMKYET